MNVVMVNTARNRGGAAKMAATLIQAFSDSTSDVKTTLVHFGDDDLSAKFVGLRRSWVAYAVALQTRLLGGFRVRDFGVSREILRHAATADVIHLHNVHGYYVNYVDLLRGLTDKPVVWTWHDMWGATGRCGSAADCKRWLQGCTPCPCKSAYPAAWIDHSGSEFEKKFAAFSALKFYKIVCPSRWLADIAVTRGYPSDRVVAIPNTVDTAIFRPRDRRNARAALGLDTDRPLALFIAENCDDSRKGYPDFCDATRSLDCDAVALGSPPTKPAKHVNHIGRVANHNTLALYYAAADVMLIPSYADNFPNTVVESLVTGTPVIGYDEGGIPDQLADEWSVVTPKGDRIALAAALAGKFADLKRTRACSMALSKQSLSRWSFEVVTAAYRQVYRSLVDEAKSGLL